MQNPAGIFTVNTRHPGKQSSGVLGSVRARAYAHAWCMPRVGTQLSRIVAASGALSRRLAHEAVLGGRVTVNGAVCRKPHLRFEALPGPDVIALDGAELQQLGETARLWRYHKPRGLITTHSDPMGRQHVFGSLPEDLPRVVSAGRLDAASEGLLMLTTHGTLARKLELPSTGLTRIYRARIAVGQRAVTSDMVEELARGLLLSDGTQLRQIRVTPESSTKTQAWVRMELTEGKNRECRRVWEHYGFATSDLIRIQYGPFELGDLAPGQLAEVDSSQVQALMSERASRSDDIDETRLHGQK